MVVDAVVVMVVRVLVVDVVLVVVVDPVLVVSMVVGARVCPVVVERTSGAGFVVAPAGGTFWRTVISLSWHFIVMRDTYP